MTWREYLFFTTGPSSLTRTILRYVVAAVVIPVSLVASFIYFTVGMAFYAIFMAAYVALPLMVLYWLLARLLAW